MEQPNRHDATEQPHKFKQGTVLNSPSRPLQRRKFDEGQGRMGCQIDGMIVMTG